MTTSTIKLAVGLPAYGGVIAAEHARMWLNVGYTLDASKGRFSLRMFGIVDECGIDRVRSKILQIATDEGCDWLLMMDADVWVADEHALLRMISEADRAGAAIVCAPVRRRRVGEGDSEIMAYVNATLTPLSQADLALAQDVAERRPEQLSFITIDACATACIAINLQSPALQQLDKPWFRFTYVHSEDIDFCERVRAAGGRILCDPRVRTFHRARAPVLAG